MQFTKQLILSITVICSFTLGNTNISGTVTNKHNNQSLQGCNVTLEGSNIGTTTDKNGYFYIHNLEPGIYNIHVKYVGYITAKKTINIIKNQSLTIDFSVSPTVIKGNEVVVTATKTKHRLAEIPGRVNVITKAELRSLPTKSLDDILKYLSGLDVHRTSGIYEIRPVVSLRGHTLFNVDKSILTAGNITLILLVFHTAVGMFLGFLIYFLYLRVFEMKDKSI